MSTQEDITGSVSHLYHSQFVPERYLAQYYCAVDEEEKFFLSQLHNFFVELGIKQGNSMQCLHLI